MKLRKLLHLLLVAIMLFSFVGCYPSETSDDTSGVSKIMTIKQPDDITTIAPGKSLQLRVYSGTKRLTRAVLAVVSGPATISGSKLTGNSDANDGDIIIVGAILDGYTCENFSLTVVCPAQKNMTLNTVENITEIQPGNTVQFEVFDGSQKLSGATFSIVSGPAKIDGTGLLTCNLDAQNDALITVSAYLENYICEVFQLTVVIPPAIVKKMTIKPAGNATTIAPSGILTLAAYENNTKLSGVTFSVVSGPAAISGSPDRLVCSSTATNDEQLVIRASLPDYELTSDYVLTVAAPSPWSSVPTVKSVFYEDFSSGVSSSVWEISNQKWGANNNGQSRSNVFVSTNRSIAEDFGAENGGIAVLQSNGDFFQPSGALNRRREGSCLITRKDFGPGKYEVRLKVVPRLGQCSTTWTYWRGDAGNSSITFENYKNNRYSEIDIETSLWADYRNILGVSYQHYSEYWDWATGNALRRDAVYYDGGKLSPYNDGQWHTFCFDWRTNAATGDNKVVWYLDGVEFGRTTQWVPQYTATFWIGNWFPDDVSWIGDPLFESAYMYIDWVRITEYNDPVSKGATGSSGGSATNLGNNPIPLNNYITNGKFEQALTVKNTKNADITSWKTTNSSKGANQLNIGSNGNASQVISAAYEGFTYDLNIDAEVTGGNGKCKVYVEYLTGNAAVTNPSLTLRGVSEAIDFSAGARQSKKLTFTVGGGFQTNHIRVVIETEQGTTASIYEAKMFLR